MNFKNIKNEIARLKHNGDLSEYGAISLMGEVVRLENQTPIKWISYNWDNPLSHPKQYDKYLVQRKDGKIHWETWNGSGFAYNGNVITHWAIITKP